MAEEPDSSVTFLFEPSAAVQGTAPQMNSSSAVDLVILMV
jgi:hypothetical protein